MRRLILLLLCAPLMGQNWSTFLDASRAIDFSAAGFTIPSYTVNCVTQPSLVAGIGNATANTTSIVTALNSCDATHNVVNIPAGTWYTNQIVYPDHGKQVLRGAGPTLTRIIFQSTAGCAGGIGNQGICMHDSNGTYNGNPNVLPPSGTTQCLWTAGFSQGTTSITLSSCGGTPPNGKLIILDQKNDTSDTGGVYICQQDNSTDCNNNGTGNNDGRVIGGVSYSQQQVTKITNVVALGGGSFTVTIFPGVYFTNVRIGQTPGAWWPGFVQLDGVENMKLDGTALDGGTIAMGQCYQCWVKNVVSIFAHRNHVGAYMSLDGVIRDSYFYQARNHSTSSYGVEFEESSQFLVENNIFQQTVAPVIFGQGSGTVIAYNFSIYNWFCGNYGALCNPPTPVVPDVAEAPNVSHNSGNEMNLWEGNVSQYLWSDNSWGSSAQNTYFRNALSGYQATFRSDGVCGATILCEQAAILIRPFSRAYNVVGNVLGQPSFPAQYEMYATSTSGGVNGNEDKTVYSLGWATGGFGGSSNGACVATLCDSLVRSTMMRWGNFDTANNAIRWNSTEAAPGAVTFVSANFTTTYFNSLAQTLPASLYYNVQPSWWPSGKNWPPIGPDVVSGNAGICSGGTYDKSMATASGQCTGGSLSTAWASHVTSIPAFDCYLNIMNGPPDGSGSVLSFDASQCYSPISTAPAPAMFARGNVVITGSGGTK